MGDKPAMKYTKLGLPAVSGGTVKQKLTAGGRARQRIKNQAGANRVIKVEMRATQLRSELAAARAKLRKNPGQAKFEARVTRVAAELSAHRPIVAAARAALSATDLALAQQVVDAQRRQRSTQKVDALERRRTSRVGRSRGVRLTGGGPVKDL